MADSLHFKSLEVIQMPGVAPGKSFRLSNISPSVNVVYGPNESGKTTTARSIQKVLWPATEPDEASILADIDAAGSGLSVSVSKRKAQWLRSSVVTEPPTLPPASANKRYSLALRDLITDEDSDLAVEIMRQAGGGCDILAAADELGFSEKPTVPTNNIKQVRSARDELNNARTESDVAAQKINDLIDLRARQSAAIHAATEAQQVARAIKVLEAREALDQCQMEVTAFPEQMSLLKGDEADRWDKISSEIESEQKQLDLARSEKETLDKDLSGLSFSESGPNENAVLQLRDACSSLKMIETSLAQFRVQLEGARTRAEKAGEGEGQTFDPAAATVKSKDVEAVFSAAQNMEEKANAAARLREELSWTGEEPPALSSDLLLKADFLLSQWLASAEGGAQGTNHPANLLMLLLHGAGLCLGVVCGALLHPVWLALAGVSAISLLLIFLLQRSRSNVGLAGNRSHLQEQYGSLKAPPPASWTADAVYKARQDLGPQRAQALLLEERAQKRPAVESKLKEAEADVAAEQQALRELAEPYGLGSLQPHRLFYTLKRLADWRTYMDEVSGATAEVCEHEKQARELIEKINALLAGCGEKPCSDAHSAAAAVQSLSDRTTSYKTIATELKAASQKESSAQQNLSKRQEELRGLKLQAGLSEDCSRQDISVLLGKLESYRAASEKLQRAEHAHQSALLEVSSDPPMPFSSVEELKAVELSAQARAAEAQSISEEIGKMESDIAKARAQAAVEDARSKLEASISLLEAQRDSNMEAIAGKLLADDLQRKVYERSLPAVFHRASELLSQFTDDRWKLTFGGGPKVGFLAESADGSQSLTLDQLSTGTRIQLLLAVRLAFVESQEGIALPILLDETLANSDEERSETIIRTVARLARSGRQVFYFTSKSHETRRWQQVVQEEDTSLTQFDLSEIRDLVEEKG